MDGAIMFLDNVFADRQTDACPILLGRKERLEQNLDNVGRNHFSVVFHAQIEPAIRSGGNDVDVLVCSILHSVDRIVQQIDDDLL